MIDTCTISITSPDTVIYYVTTITSIAMATKHCTLRPQGQL